MGGEISPGGKFAKIQSLTAKKEIEKGPSKKKRQTSKTNLKISPGGTSALTGPDYV